MFSWTCKRPYGDFSKPTANGIFKTQFNEILRRLLISITYHNTKKIIKTIKSIVLQIATSTRLYQKGRYNNIFRFFKLHSLLSPFSSRFDMHSIKLKKNSISYTLVKPRSHNSFSRVKACLHRFLCIVPNTLLVKPILLFPNFYPIFVLFVL